MPRHRLDLIRQKKDPRDFLFKAPRKAVDAMPDNLDVTINKPPFMPPLDQHQEGSCHDDKTEVLTENGWCKFSDLSGMEKLASVDPITSKLIYERPTRLVAYHYVGDMYYGCHKSIDFAVTPDHMMLVRKWSVSNASLKDNYTLEPMKDIGWYSGLMSKVSYEGTSNSDICVLKGVPNVSHADQRVDIMVPMKSWLRFLGLYLAEGTMVSYPKKTESKRKCLVAVGQATKYKIQIAASKKREKEFARGVFKEIGVVAYEQKDRFQFKSKRIFKALESLGLLGVKAPQKFVPDFVFRLGAEYIEQFLLGHFMGDGYIIDGEEGKQDRVFHSTSSPRLADDLQRLIFLAGSMSSIVIRELRQPATMKDGRKVQAKHKEHRVGRNDNQSFCLSRKDYVTKRGYDGMVYCAEVPTYHTLVTRRNRRILISGNCGPTSLAKNILWDNLTAYGSAAIPSRNFMYYWTRYMMGTVNQDSGVDNRTMMKALAKYGYCDETMWPYDKGNMLQRPNQAAITQGSTRTPGIMYAAVPQTLNDMKGCLFATNRPWIFGFSISQSMINYMENGPGAANGVIPLPTLQELSHGLEASIGGHDILVVGYSDVDRPGMSPGNTWPAHHFKAQNHWYNAPGQPWGDMGFAYIPYELALNHTWAGDYWTVNSAPEVTGPPAPTPPPIVPPAPMPPSPIPPGPSPFPPSPINLQQEIDNLFAQAIAQYANRPVIVAALRMAQGYIHALLASGVLRTPYKAGVMPDRKMSIVGILNWVKQEVKNLGPIALPIIEAYLATLGLSALELTLVDSLVQDLLGEL